MRQPDGDGFEGASRRAWLRTAAAGFVAGGLLPGTAWGESGADAEAAHPAADTPPRFQYSLNTSTIRGQELPLDEQVRIAAEAGYDAIEPWLRDIVRFVEAGGKLSDIRKRIADAGLSVPSAIGFWDWIVDDPARRAAGMEAARRDMDLVAQIGGLRIAAPPAGATNQSDLNLQAAAERYHALLEVGDRLGVVPQLELWGFSRSLSRLGEVMHVAVEAGHPRACILPDIYHIYKGGSDFQGMNLIAGGGVHVFHVNDYPADPPRSEINDSHRVYPGDGVAPLADIFRFLRQTGFEGVLSLELFNREYWQQDPLLVARTGLQKMKASVAAGLDAT